MDFKDVKQVNVKKGMTVDELVKEFSACGVVGAGRVAEAAAILENMIKEKECKKFFGLAGAMVPLGMKNVVIEMLKDGMIDVLVSTGANLTHDLIEGLGFAHLKGHHTMSDGELNKKGYDRIYDALMKNDVYIKMEEFLKKIVNEIKEKELSVKELLWIVGGRIENRGSILRVCADKKIPIFSPAFDNSGFGIQLSYLLNEKKINVPLFKDLHDIMNIAWDSKVKSVFYVGGGEPKNYIQQAMQFSPDPAEYGIQITGERAELGGSSGAPMKEGVSWGKMKATGQFVDVFADATIVLPLIVAAAKSRL